MVSLRWLPGHTLQRALNFVFALRHSLTTEDLKTTMFAYSPGASNIGSMLLNSGPQAALIAYQVWKHTLQRKLCVI